MKKQISTRTDIILLVDEFYKQATTDSQIGHFFTEVIADNWAKHKTIIQDYWETILFGKALYRGQAMQKHLDLNRLHKILPAHLERWIELWKNTVDRYFEGEIAENAKERAEWVKKLIEHKLKENN